jgi:hypothetical protein
MLKVLPASPARRASIAALSARMSVVCAIASMSAEQRFHRRAEVGHVPDQRIDQLHEVADLAERGLDHRGAFAEPLDRA